MKIRNPSLFVVGCPRSGTTLLQRMLDSHPEMAVANDSHFIPRVLEKHAPWDISDAVAGRNPALSSDLLAGILSYHRFPRMGVGSSEVESAAQQVETYAELVSSIYDLFASHHGKPRAGEKTPDYVRQIPLLKGLFPHAQFVHIIRDGRDVALSLRDWAGDKKGPGRLERWREDPIAVSALWWSWQVNCGRRAGRRLAPGRYLELRYEDLVKGPELELEMLCSFLQLPFCPEMLNFHAGRQRRGSSLSAKSAWLPPTPGLRNWREDMAAEDLAVFEAIAGPTLKALGLGCQSQRSQETCSKADEFTAWWRSQMRRKRARARVRRQSCA